MIPNMPATYASIARKIGTREDAVKIGHNTTAERDGRAIVVRYHGHEIARMTAETILLTDAGYRTATTKTRLNLLAPAGVSIFQRAHEWFVSTREGETAWNGVAIFSA